jgi:hypothetical protein
MAQPQKAFSLSSKNLWFQVTLLLLAIAAGLGINFPSSPEAIAGDIVNTFTNSGIYAVIGILVVSVIGPIYNFIKSKPKLSLKAFVADANNWVYIVSFLASGAILLGINIPAGTAEQLVAAVFARDWAGIASVAVGSIVVPLVRYFIDKAANSEPITPSKN